MQMKHRIMFYGVYAQKNNITLPRKFQLSCFFVNGCFQWQCSKSILHSSNFWVYTSHKSSFKIDKEKIINSEYRSKLTIHQKHYLKSSRKQQKWILLNMLKVLSVTPKSSTIIIPHIFIKELLFRYCGVR